MTLYKRFPVLILAMIFGLFFLLSACGSSSSPSGPEKDQLERDLTESLENYKNFLTLSSYEITQSLTEDRNYSATAEVIAESEYAQFQLQAEVTYTKYDQGWSIDSCELEELSYQVIHYPTEDTIDSLIKSGAEAKSPEGDRTLVSLTQNDDYTVVSESSVNMAMGTHITQIAYITSSWSYNPVLNNWEVTASDLVYETPKLSGIEGNWPGIAGDIIVSNVSDNGFDVYYTYLDLDTVHVAYNEDFDLYEGKLPSGVLVSVKISYTESTNKTTIAYNAENVGDYKTHYGDYAIIP